MSPGFSVLIISNGHGKDLMGSVLARELQRVCPKAQVSAFPVVGWGNHYRNSGIPVVGVQKAMPSGGWIRQSLAAFWQDVQAGLLILTWRQIRALKSLRFTTDLVIPLGDIYPLFLSYRYVKRPIVFLPTAKSEYISGHLSIEKKRMRQYCKLVFPRDELTAERLRQDGVPAVYLGNLIMDSLVFSSKGFPLPEGPVVGILPGSRDEAYRNMGELASAALSLHRRVPEARFLVAVASELRLAGFEEILRTQRWYQMDLSGLEEDFGIVGGFYKEGCELYFVTGRFGDVLQASRVCLGMAGTANEQAVGLGKPVIAFAGDGPQFTARFLQAQKRLLGEALITVERNPEAVARAAQRILEDEQLYHKLSVAGRVRMGGPGAAQRMSKKICELARELKLLH